MIVVESESDLKPWQQTFQGLTWQDMPGNQTDEQKIKFALFRRGLYKPERDEDGRVTGGSLTNFGKPVKMHHGVRGPRMQKVREWLAGRVEGGMSAGKLARETGVHDALISRVLRRRDAGMSPGNTAKIEAVMEARGEL